MNVSSEVVTPTRRRTQSKRSRLPAADLPPAPPLPPLLDDSATLAEPANEDASDVTRLSGRVRFARLLVNLTKAELARRVGVCLSAAVQWELVKGTSPNVSNLVKIATIAGVGFEWLATGRGSPVLQTDLPPATDSTDLDYEVRLIAAARAIARDRREVLVDVARSMGEP